MKHDRLKILRRTPGTRQAGVVVALFAGDFLAEPFWTFEPSAFRRQLDLSYHQALMIALEYVDSVLIIAGLDDVTLFLDEVADPQFH
jgi:hypothetical protein